MSARLLLPGSVRRELTAVAALPGWERFVEQTRQDTYTCPWLPVLIPVPQDGTVPARKPSAPCPRAAVPRNRGWKLAIKQNTEDAWLSLCLKALCAPSSPRPLRPVRMRLSRWRLRMTTRPRTNNTSSGSHRGIPRVCYTSGMCYTST